MATIIASNGFLQRLVGAAALDSAIYEEVEADATATLQAFVVVLLSSMAAGIGLSGFFSAGRGLTASSIGNVVVVSIIALLAWAAWALVTYQIGARLLPQAQTVANVGELLRTLGFAAAPGVLQVFGVIPGAAIPAFLVSSVWMVLAMIVAVRQALDYTSTLRAVAVCVIGWSLAFAMAMVLGVLFGPTVS
jgi:hypothetical protein